MNTVVLSWRFLLSRPLTALLNCLLMSLGLASITFMVLLKHQLDNAFERDLAGIDLVVGAKGSPLQLILAGVFHLDVPSGNVPLKAIEVLGRNSQVAKLIPISLGDSLDTFRIVGTTLDYPKLYGAQLAQGVWWSAPMEVTVGSQVAAQTGLKPGDLFAGAHGLAVLRDRAIPAATDDAGSDHGRPRARGSRGQSLLRPGTQICRQR